MYVTTFYSFKGGVGRSMALANAAVELAKRGRRVLAVDFDLEAPGLDTFAVLRPRHEVPGIIDFVHEYLDSNRPPDARRFLARSPYIGERGGELWIMPSGAQRPSYAAHFNQIDWAELYDKQDGYLLFEDLKAQWQQEISPDYVLIDSRTGHTDTGGICTRQLPDAVAILFFPNEQNLRGLTKVVHDIRSEANGPHGRDIELHFVMSNVPDLDDEDRILEEQIQAFRDKLALTRDPLVVHRYDSLSLLNQVLFTLDRPRSRLAREYGVLVQEIVGRNLADRDGALEYLEQATTTWRRRRGTYESTGEIDKKLQKIKQEHAEDGEVLFSVGKFLELDFRVKRDASLFDVAIEAGYEEPEVYLQRARVRSRNNDQAGASEDALHVLQSENVPPLLIWEAVSLTAGDKSDGAATSPALMSLDVRERIALAGALNKSVDQIMVSISILEHILADTAVGEEDRGRARGSLAMNCIAIGQYGHATELLCHAERSIEEMDIGDAFNYGMALWGDTRRIDADPFLRVLKLDQDQSGPESATPDYLQRMAIARWATGDLEMAADFATRARKTVRGSAFTRWRYVEVSASEFKEDIDDIQALIAGDTERTPRFMRQGSAGT